MHGKSNLLIVLLHRKLVGQMFNAGVGGGIKSAKLLCKFLVGIQLAAIG
jgi:hypothetical protein